MHSSPTTAASTLLLLLLTVLSPTTTATHIFPRQSPPDTTTPKPIPLPTCVQPCLSRLADPALIPDLPAILPQCAWLPQHISTHPSAIKNTHACLCADRVFSRLHLQCVLLSCGAESPRALDEGMAAWYAQCHVHGGVSLPPPGEMVTQLCLEDELGNEMVGGEIVGEDGGDELKNMDPPERGAWLADRWTGLTDLKDNYPDVRMQDKGQGWPRQTAHVLRDEDGEAGPTGNRTWSCVPRGFEKRPLAVWEVDGVVVDGDGKKEEEEEGPSLLGPLPETTTTKIVRFGAAPTPVQKKEGDGEEEMWVQTTGVVKRADVTPTPPADAVRVRVGAVSGGEPVRKEVVKVPEDQGDDEKEAGAHGRRDGAVAALVVAVAAAVVGVL